MAPRLLELAFGLRGIFDAALRKQRLPQTVERPAVLRVALEIGAADALGFFEAHRAHQRGAERLARRVEPVRRLVVTERVFSRDRALPRLDGVVTFARCGRD